MRYFLRSHTDALIILRVDATSIVLHLDRIQSIIFEPHLCKLLIRPTGQIRKKQVRTDRSSSGVQAIFHQLLYHRAKVNNDLSGLDLMDLFQISIISTSSQMK